ncbi:unnamed protein product [Nezara viridula]|uniref:Uncharacterized protein n=1 Tax=Nezara viridula TaxID=85310 RepID=A0A9P0E867_NEZVI|nr:unnamed protein product [Nezara viridula]
MRSTLFDYDGPHNLKIDKRIEVQKADKETFCEYLDDRQWRLLTILKHSRKQYLPPPMVTYRPKHVSYDTNVFSEYSLTTSDKVGYSNLLSDKQPIPVNALHGQKLKLKSNKLAYQRVYYKQLKSTKERGSYNLETIPYINECGRLSMFPLKSIEGKWGHRPSIRPQECFGSLIKFYRRMVKRAQMKDVLHLIVRCWQIHYKDTLTSSKVSEESKLPRPIPKFKFYRYNMGDNIPTNPPLEKAWTPVNYIPLKKINYKHFNCLGIKFHSNDYLIRRMFEDTRTSSFDEMEEYCFEILTKFHHSDMLNEVTDYIDNLRISEAEEQSETEEMVTEEEILEESEIGSEEDFGYICSEQSCVQGSDAIRQSSEDDLIIFNDDQLLPGFSKDSARALRSMTSRSLDSVITFMEREEQELKYTNYNTYFYNQNHVVDSESIIERRQRKEKVDIAAVDTAECLSDCIYSTNKDLSLHSSEISYHGVPLVEKMCKMDLPDNVIVPIYKVADHDFKQFKIWPIGWYSGWITLVNKWICRRAALAVMSPRCVTSLPAYDYVSRTYLITRLAFGDPHVLFHPGFKFYGLNNPSSYDKLAAFDESDEEISNDNNQESIEKTPLSPGQSVIEVDKKSGSEWSLDVFFKRSSKKPSELSLDVHSQVTTPYPEERKGRFIDVSDKYDKIKNSDKTEGTIEDKRTWKIFKEKLCKKEKEAMYSSKKAVSMTIDCDIEEDSEYEILKDAIKRRAIHKDIFGREADNLQDILGNQHYYSQDDFISDITYHNQFSYDDSLQDNSQLDEFNNEKSPSSSTESFILRRQDRAIPTKKLKPIGMTNNEEFYYTELEDIDGDENLISFQSFIQRLTIKKFQKHDYDHFYVKGCVSF